MADPHNYDHHSPAIYAIDDSIVSDTNTIMVGLGLKLLNAGWKRTLAECGCLGCDALLDRAVE